MTVAISCGEPAGIGPEIVSAAWKHLRSKIPMLWIGDPLHLPADLPTVQVHEAQDAAALSENALPMLALDMAPPRTPGTPVAAHAKGVIEAIEIGAKLAKSGACTALCTSPIHKQALAEGAGFRFPGHTEFLCELDNKDHVVMMLACPELRVVPTTIHIPISDVPKHFTAELLERTILQTVSAIKTEFGIRTPRISVAGLNPHAGEGGRMGREELEVMLPVIERLRSEGLSINGPLSADTMFHPIARKSYDAAICAYHDQALIPIKTLDFSGGVNITLGLDFVRTSPDHGTAFDIAGKGLADPTSMIAAIEMAWEMGNNRQTR